MHRDSENELERTAHASLFVHGFLNGFRYSTTQLITGTNPVIEQ